MKRLFFIITVFFALTFSVNAATYTAYFSNAATGNATGTDTAVALSDCQGGDAANTCSTLAHAQAYIELAGSGDTVNLYFDRTDTWTMNTDAIVTTTVFGIAIGADDPIVNIDAYGSGAKPKFYGTVSSGGTWFDAVPSHNSTTGPKYWSTIFMFEKDGCSVKNIHIDGVYGCGIIIGASGSDADNFTLESCDITNFGAAAIKASDYYGTQGAIITKNLIHTGQQLYRYGKYWS